MKPRSSLLFPLLLTIAHSACKSTHETSAEPVAMTSASAIASDTAPPPVPTGPAVSCLNLPPKGRYKMQVSKDQKTVYYLELTLEYKAAGERTERYALVALDVETKTTKTIDDNVGFDAVVTSNGQVVFARSESGSAEYRSNRRLYVRDPSQAEPTMLSPKTGKDVTDFVVDEEKSNIIYVDDSKIYQVPLAGGPAKKIADGWLVDAVVDGGVLVRQLFDRRNLVRFDGKKGKEFKIKDEERFGGVNAGMMITLASDSDRLVLQAQPIDGNGTDPKKELVIDRGARTLRWGHSGQIDQVIAKYDQDTRIFQIHGVDVKKIFASTGAPLAGYAELDNGTKVVHVCHDTHGNQMCDQFDESDICFIERAPADTTIDIPTHTAPTPLKDAAEKMVTLTTDGDLSGAKIKYLVRDDGGYQAVFESPLEGPVNTDELRTRARALQSRVTELSGLPSLSIRIDFANGFFASTEWHEATKRFYSFGGIGAAELADVKEYPVEIETTIVSGWDTSTCRGKLKNISDKPLEKITVECVPVSSYGPRKAPGKGKLSPLVLAPGVEGQFMTTNFDYSQYSSGDVRIVVKQGDQEIRPFNRYSTKKSLERWEHAVAIYNAAGLSYMGRLNGSEMGAIVVASPAFQKLDKGEQEKACAKAVEEMIKLRMFTRIDSKKIVLKIHDPLADKTRWQYKEGKLSDVEG